MLALQHSAGNAAVNRLLRDLAPPVAGSNPDPGTATPATVLLVANDATDLAPGQIRVGDFATQLEAALCSLADSMLHDQAQGCPWVRYWIASYRSKAPSEIEQILSTYAPGAASAQSGPQLIGAIVERVRAGIASWQQTGQLDPTVAAAAGPVVQRTPADGSATATLSRLGAGRPLDAAVAGRIGAAMGADFSGVRVHDDPAAAATAASHHATALTVGRHIAFAANQYAPGTPVGDALIAHELAHVVQQGNGRVDRAIDGAHAEAALEADADRTAAAALTGLPDRSGARPRARTGLRLQRCGRGSAPAATTAPPVAATPGATTAAGTDVMAGTHAVTQDQQTHIESILHPGTTVVVSPPPVSGGPAPVPHVQLPDPMTGAGDNGQYEKDIWKVTKDNIKYWSDQYAIAKANPALTSAEFNALADLAQAEAEAYFAPWINSASRQAGDVYHPGTYKLAGKLLDMSTIVIHQGDREWWVDYWMNTRGKPTKNAHKVSQPRDDAEVKRVVVKFAADAANTAQIDDSIHNWPALSVGTDTYFQRYKDSSTTEKKRSARWDIFTTMIHEFMHKLQHPNFERVHVAFGGDAQMDLREGFADLMRHELWDGPGKLADKVVSDASFRAKVEGGNYPYDASLVAVHGDYDQVDQARQIRDQVGIENCKAAFFSGRTELLGIGPASSTTTPLAGSHLSEWTAADATDAETYVVPAGGETVAAIALKCGVDPAVLAKADGTPLPAGYAPAAGERLKVPGIRYIHAIEGDTLAKLGEQYGVSENAVAAANGLAIGAALTAGARYLIPHRR
jgi:hypothetical protein